VIGGALLKLAVAEVQNTEVDEVAGVERILLGSDLHGLDAVIQIAHNRGIVVTRNI
jgi:hypothetical protein